MVMAIQKQIFEDKHCFVYCGPERCNCRAGNPLLTQDRETLRRAWDLLGLQTVMPVPAQPPMCISCGARNHPNEDGGLPCGH